MSQDLVDEAKFNHLRRNHDRISRGTVLKHYVQ